MWYNQFWGSIPLDLSNLSKNKLAKLENNMEFVNVFQDLYTTALNEFKYENLPDTCDARMIERSFLLSGYASFVEYKGKLINLVPGTAGGFTLYGYSNKYWGYGYNGFNIQFGAILGGADELEIIKKGADGVNANERYFGVVGLDNANAYPYINYIIRYAKRLADTSRALDVAIQNLKQPIIITCEESAVNSIRQALNSKESNVAAIISAGKLPIDTFNVWDTHANPAIPGEIRNHYEWLKNGVNELLGLNANENPDKKERLLVDEVNANNESIENSTDKRLKYRKEFIEMVNNTFGTNITVERNIEAPRVDFQEIEEDDEDVDE